MLLIKYNFRPVLAYILWRQLNILSQAMHAPRFWQGCTYELQVQSIKHRLWTKSVVWVVILSLLIKVELLTLLVGRPQKG